MAHSLTNGVHTSEGLTGIRVFLILIRVDSKTESLDHLSINRLIDLICYSLEEFNSLVLIDVHKEISDLVLESLIFRWITTLVYYIVYYYLTHSHFHAFSFSKDVPVFIISRCLFEKVLLVAPLIGL